MEKIDIPIIDLSVKKRHMLIDEMVKACEEFGFFKVINHGVSMEVVQKMEDACLSFFSLPSCEKEKEKEEFGYGIRNIGCNGDIGEVEYLLLHANVNSNDTSQRVTSTCHKDRRQYLRSKMNEYVKVVRKLTCEILDMLGEGLGVPDKEIFSKLVRQKDNDSLLRFNFYPVDQIENSPQSRVGFGEHSDPQILTLLRSNNVAGLQIRSIDSTWVPVSPDPNAFFVNVGDTLEALTNGRLVSVRHRAMKDSYCSTRLSTVYFAAPPLHTLISPLPETITLHRPRLYQSFTWEEFKKTMYSLKLGSDRLVLFALPHE